MSDVDQERAARVPVDVLNPIALIVPVAIMGMAVLVLSRRRAMLVQKPDGATAKKTAGPAAKKTAGPAAKKTAGPAARVAARQTVRTVRQARRTGRKTMQRMVLTILINALENDVMRRAIIMWLKLKLARSRLPV
jgi:cytochrome P450